ncbi:hypothetical protein AJ81_03885 [Pseudothermotoga hypogea DSM 11164 = NBRC 106472]|uniref:GLUG domain-containing protein n=1 Tax=Pseudothermotoga hypogea DSM 11164 = NBRC 106472 TaxID=1123384 RepID=A0A0X1KU14_9THEM|nr:carboxypeptidase-like regulatory domain-containing protein [Pseudothermotoga hypogea]AJC74696.1 hypothetical protein AJ81_03885 [Pseudothermotoga hypogea DSM 11164 = NBRC 106472]MBC7121810.1 carboxypeptidase regulatory-like domain-containing protein [Pseudothermotoga sp.]
MRKWQILLVSSLVLFLLFSCAAPVVPGEPSTYTIQGVVKLWNDTPLQGVTISAGTKTATTDANGTWTIADLSGAVTVRAQNTDYHIVIAGTVQTTKNVSNASTINFTAYSETEEFGGGYGTQDDPWIIVNVWQLDNMRHYVDPSTPRHYKQMRDLDLNDLIARVTPTEANWTPVDSMGPDKPFNGSYNGMGFSIKNMVVLTGNNTSDRYSGFFGRLFEATITNVVFENAQVDYADAFDAGVLAGRIDDSTIDNVIVLNSRVSQASYMGGLVGFASSSTFKNCSVQVILNSPQANPSFYVGGFVGDSSFSNFQNCTVRSSAITGKSTRIGGFAANSDTSVFQNCRFQGTIEDVTATYVGGFVAYAEQDEDLSVNVFEDCAVSASLSAQRDTSTMDMVRIGGFVGFIDAVKRISFKTCVVQADIEVPHYGFTAGGFFAEISGLNTFHQCGFQGSITGNSEEFSDIGGFGGFAYNPATGEVNIQECYARFEVNADSNARVAGFLSMTDGNNITIKNCYAKGSTSAQAQSAGFLRMNTLDQVPDVSKNYVAVSNTDHGFLYNFSSSSLQTPHCYWDNQLTSTIQDHSTAEGKGTSQMKTQSTYSTWDFTNVWAINAVKNDGYPYLRWEDGI